MPPSRRKSGNHPTTRSAASQSILSFNSKSAQVTKPSTVDRSGQKASLKLSEPAVAQVIDVVSGQHKTDDVKTELEVSEEPITQQVNVRVKPVVKDESEVRAAKVTDVQLRRYWKAEEDRRKAPRVHQELLSTNEKILRHFDLSSQFGPCIGMPRLQRWKRADRLALKPPIEVLAILLRGAEGKGTGKENQHISPRAYIDELASGGRGLTED